jgi:hypothetical protein
MYHIAQDMGDNEALMEEFWLLVDYAAEEFGLTRVSEWSEFD